RVAPRLPSFTFAVPMTHFHTAILATFALCLSCFAQEKTDAQKEADARAKIESWIRGLQYQTGKIALRNGLATADVPPQFKYLNAADAGKLLQLLGNPPQESLGIIFPAETDLL